MGTFAIQFAKKLGAEVYVTASPNHKEFLKDVGADGVIDYHQSHAFDNFKKVDALLDLIGGRVLSQSYQLVKEGGRLLTTNGMPDQKMADKYGIIAMFSNLRVENEILAKIANYVAVGQIKTFVTKQFNFTLEQVKQALALSEQGHVSGKIVINF
ncbi:zinc-binding dehydrogenase [Lentilactobacillus diolivorans]|uniref:Uncharacterized protein n=2 Tax=Lentilactobacillus diolivorans TaxID=179838 RepID=A0A0R1SHR9_9LACO|nr:zinc-binding dehydrogenase [Lentilactobacillus diolivorans]KRL68636.1 hypothetical protein FC85_GL002457 [Lentilactobacillus diolivorans DSM 14421]GEP24880.1 hypothetical protein LDI01_24730 [Lentilactobacillus diolivorans]